MKYRIIPLIAVVGLVGFTGVSAAGNNVSQTPAAASAVSVYTPSEQASFDVIADGKTFTYTDEQIAASDFTVAEEIENRRINMPLSVKIELVDEYIRRGADYKTALSVCFPRLDKLVKEVSDAVYEPPVDSHAEYVGGVFKATREKYGRRLDENRLYASIYYCIKYGVKNTVNAATVKIEPNLTQDDLQRNLVKRSEFTTDYSTSTPDRAHNVELAVKKLDGVRLAAGDTLSFNALVGARTVENGYRKAKVIIDGKYADGVGGGACQASTAAYNAALLAGLKCNANSHTICPSYCPPGLDAMISSASDLTIVNDTGSDVYFSVRTDGSRATVKVVGAPREYDYVPESVVVRTIPFAETETTDEERKYFDESAVSGDRILISPGRNGYESETYLNCVKNGTVVKRVLLRRNFYSSTPRITVVAP